jgi:hypothetical protein
VVIAREKEQSMGDHRKKRKVTPEDIKLYGGLIASAIGIIFLVYLLTRPG